jgi:hypothetical protein
MPTPEQANRPLVDPYFWFGLASAVAAVGAAVFAWVSSRVARQALQLEQQRELRRRPTLVPYLADGLCRYGQASRTYAFSLSISNPSDIDNSIALVELQIDYVIRDGILMSLKLPAGRAAEFGAGNLSLLVPPLRVDAHQTIAGWLVFELKEALIGNSRIDNYTVLLQDSHGATTRLEQAVIRELGNEDPRERLQN